MSSFLRKQVLLMLFLKEQFLPMSFLRKKTLMAADEMAVDWMAGFLLNS